MLFVFREDGGVRADAGAGRGPAHNCPRPHQGPEGTSYRSPMQSRARFLDPNSRRSVFLGFPDSDPLELVTDPVSDSDSSRFSTLSRAL